MFDDENSNSSLPSNSLDDSNTSCLSASASSSPQSFSSECDHLELIEYKYEPMFTFGQDETNKEVKKCVRNKKKPEISKILKKNLYILNNFLTHLKPLHSERLLAHLAGWNFCFKKFTGGKNLIKF